MKIFVTSRTPNHRGTLMKKRNLKTEILDPLFLFLFLFFSNKDFKVTSKEQILKSATILIERAFIEIHEIEAMKKAKKYQN